MSELLQILLTAITVGSLYALIALGYTMVYGILKFINFAHSDVFVLGAWASFTVGTLLIALIGLEPGAIPWWLGGLVLLAAMAVCGSVAFLIERLAYRPLRKAPRLNVLITAIGVSLLLQNVGQLQWLFNGSSAVLVAGAAGPGPVNAVTLESPLRLQEGQAYEVRLADSSGKREGPKSLRVKSASGDYKAGDKIELGEAVQEVAAGSRYELRRVLPLALPFGSRPRRMPAVLPDAALNESVIAKGALSASPTAGNVLLGAPVAIEKDRTYRLDVKFADGRSEACTVLADPGDYPTGDIGAAPVPDADQAKGATFTLVRMPVVPIQLVDVAIVVSALALMLALELLVYRTKLGTAMRAVSYSVETASLMGVNVDRVISFTFVTGAVLAGGAGFLNALKYPEIGIPANEIWVLLGLKAFVAAVVGGIGNLRGAVLGGFLIAAIEQFGNFYIDPGLQDVYVFGILILVLLLKPTGLLGSPVREKV
jgi:branched-subunit amino acid ABC-type transport system permease component